MLNSWNWVQNPITFPCFQPILVFSPWFVDGILNIYIDSWFIGKLKNIEIDIVIVDIVKAILKNIDIDIDKGIWQNIDIDIDTAIIKISI